jgi:L-asparaginase II
MLAATVAQGWEPERYIAPDHPLQAVVSDTLADFAGVPIEHTGVDGCGVPAHAIALQGLATAYARLATRAGAGEDGPAAVVGSLRRHPEMIAGSGRLDTVVLEATAGRVLAKGGAEAVYAAANLAAGPGMALKLVDGSMRAQRAAVVALLRALGWLEEAELEAVLPLATTPVLGGGVPVGEIRPASDVELE